MSNTQNYDTMSKEQLIQLCSEKDTVIEACVRTIKENQQKMLGKKDIMEIYMC